MRTIRPSTLALLAALAFAPAGFAAISGDYLEARTSDVYTGSCYANSEVGLAGREAVLAWHVREGSWEGVPVDGLAVVAAVRASATLGDPTKSPLPARSVVVLDERASPAQRTALLAFARAMGGDLLSDIVTVHDAPIAFVVGENGPEGHEVFLGRNHSALSAAHHSPFAGGSASVKAGDLIALSTRPLNHGDHLCGNEEVYYPPLADARGAVPAVTLEHSFRGPELGVTWSSPEKRSAFVGTFAR